MRKNLTTTITLIDVRIGGIHIRNEECTREISERNNLKVVHDVEVRWRGRGTTLEGDVTENMREGKEECAILTMLALGDLFGPNPKLSKTF